MRTCYDKDADARSIRFAETAVADRQGGRTGVVIRLDGERRITGPVSGDVSRHAAARACLMKACAA